MFRNIKYLYIVLGCILLTSCKTRYANTATTNKDRNITLRSKGATSVTVAPKPPVNHPIAEKPNLYLTVDKSERVKIVNLAHTYKGTPYRYAGITRNGIDCSGLVQKIYSEQSYQLPRSSYAMAQVGHSIDKADAQIGDLIFFKTAGRKRINHVGIISKIENGVIYFIHASSGSGVIESGLNESYYNKRWVQINRILD